MYICQYCDAKWTTQPTQAQIINHMKIWHKNRLQEQITELEMRTCICETNYDADEFNACPTCGRPSPRIACTCCGTNYDTTFYTEGCPKCHLANPSLDSSSLAASESQTQIERIV
jgi:hypothetical protein